MTNLDSIRKSRDITLPTKVCLVKAMVFLVIIYGCKSSTIKKAEHQRIDAFKLVLEKTLESPLNSMDIKPVNPKENQPRERLMPKRQYFGHLMRRADSLEQTRMLGKTEGRRSRGLQEDEIVGWHHGFNGHEFEQTPRYGKGQGSGVLQSMRS